ncbi:MAG: 4-hydroxybenzoate octaprenyltransferase [Pseudomonadota bacterium]
MSDTSDSTPTETDTVTEPEIEAETALPKDTALPGLLAHLPKRARPFALLARWDRPVGVWLLFLPCVIGLLQMRVPAGLQWMDLVWAVLFLLGSVAMRGAGCTWNDIADREIDAQVERTAARPLPSGIVSLRDAYAFLAVQVAIGFLVWLCLPLVAKLVALFALPLVGAYPFMKRITWWPQAWLGFTFNWGVLVGGATALGVVTGANVLMYLGLVAWTVAYDSIYALQDIEDDTLIGVRSTARLFGDRVQTAIFCFFMLATVFVFAGAYFAGAGRIGAVMALAFFGHGLWQTIQLNTRDNGEALRVFKSNVWAGSILVLGLMIAALL